jgi:hypothetical protein
MVLGLELEHLPLNALKMRGDIEQSIYLSLTKKLLQQVYIHLQPRLHFLIVIVLIVELSELQNDVHKKLFPEFSCPVFNRIVQIDEELDDQLYDVIVDLVVLDHEQKLLQELHALALVRGT